MKKVLKQIETARLVVKYLLNNLTEQEEREFEHWRKGNEDSYSKVFSLKNYDKYKKEIDKINITEEWEKFEKRLNKKNSAKVANIFPKIIRYAASILIPLLIAGSVFFFGYKGLFKEKEQQIIAETIIEPGIKKAELILSNGNQVILDETTRDSIIEADGTTIFSDSLQLKYGIDTGKQLVALYNELHVKRGWEWQLTLDDGTKVWVNSMSKLKYPVQFSGNTREVELEGEAYFEVAHNPEKPFIVKTPTYDIEVLGTSFNVSHYENDEFSHTTLVEGKIKINSSILIGDKELSLELEPDQQFYLDKIKMDTNILKVNASVYSEWKDGYFVFEDETLDNIFRKLARWYEIEYFFKDNKLRNEIYSGKLPRFKDFKTILDMIEEVSDIRFDVDKNTILIYKKP